MKTLGLLDGDIFAFQAASLSEFVHKWDDEIYTLEGDLAQAKRIAKSMIEKVRKEIKAKKLIFCRSCSSKTYWRHSYLSSYKGDRTDRPPLVLEDLKEWLMDEFESLEIEGLEADDVMGVKATDPDYYPEWRKVIVSEDKDMQTIPGWLFNPKKDYQPWKQTEEGANRYHAKQALMGDVTDNYLGCAGIGEGAAETWLKEPYQWEQYEHTFKSGKRKGETEMRWQKVEPESLLEAYLSLFLKAGQSKDEAYIMWKVARILRFTDYDYQTRKVNIPLIGDKL